MEQFEEIEVTADGRTQRAVCNPTNILSYHGLIHSSATGVGHGRFAVIELYHVLIAKAAS